MKVNTPFKAKLIDASIKNGPDIQKSVSMTQAMIAKQLERSKSIKRSAVCSWLVTFLFYAMWRILNHPSVSHSVFSVYLYDYDKTLTCIAMLVSSGFVWEVWLIIAGLLTFYAYRQSRTLTMQQILCRLTAIEKKLETS